MSKSKTKKQPRDKPMSRILLSDKFSRQINYAIWSVSVFNKDTQDVLHFDCEVWGKLSNDVRYVRPKIRQDILQNGNYEFLGLKMQLSTKVKKDFDLSAIIK